MKRMRPAHAAMSVLLLHANVFGYDIPNHFDMSKEAAVRSMLGRDSEALSRLGLMSLDQPFKTTAGINSSEFTNDCTHSGKFSIINLIGCGAQFEDVPGTRSFNHFYDPVNNTPLTVKGIEPGSVLLLPNLTSPDWALKDNNDESAQEFSYKDARNYFYKALTTGGLQTARDDLWGKLFQSIGQVVHHIQDMAQPQHVRNDQHVDRPIPFLVNPSAYEKYTSDERNRVVVRGLMSLAGANAAYTPANPGGFKRPRDFWKNAGGSGLAEFTNTNFVSAGTNFEVFAGQQVGATKYALPRPGAAEPVLTKDLSPPLSSQVLAACADQDCSMTFYGTGAGRPRAAALSIFDQYVQLRPVTYSDPMSLSTTGTEVAYQVDRIFTLNQYTFNTAHETLIPRAVAYSAGLINYFFRGKMEISLPDEGIYGIVDHAVENQKDSSGFRKIKLKLKNVTPRGSAIEPMAAGGKLMAVAKFHRNNCYAIDLSGEYGAPDRDWNTCRGKDEEIVVSEPLDLDPTKGVNNEGQALSFSFSTPIPINATDLFLQVVYRGPLGDEADAVVVATKDISEPQYVLFTDPREQSYYSLISGIAQQNYGHYTWKQAYCDAPAIPSYSYETCKSQFRKTFYMRFSQPAQFDSADPVTSFGPTVMVSELPVSSYSRIAFLTDANAQISEYSLIKDWNDSVIYGANSSYGASLVPAVVSGSPKLTQLDSATNLFTPVPYKRVRGIYVGPGGYSVLTSGDVESPPPLVPALQPVTIDSQFLASPQ